MLGEEPLDHSPTRPTHRRVEGPPLHVHTHEDEVIVVLDGHVECECGEDTWSGGPGTVFFMPRDLSHTFRSVNGPAMILFLITPATSTISSASGSVQPTPRRSPISSDDSSSTLQRHARALADGTRHVRGTAPPLVAATESSAGVVHRRDGVHGRVDALHPGFELDRQELAVVARLVQVAAVEPQVALSRGLPHVA